MASKRPPKTPTNDNQPESPELLAAREQFIKTLEGLAAQVKANTEKLNRENEQLKTAQAETQKFLDAEKAARKAQETNEMTFLARATKALAAFGAIALVIGIAYVGHNVRWGNSQQVADAGSATKSDKLEMAIAGMDKKLGDIEVQTGKNQMQIEGFNDKLSALIRADVFKGDKPAASVVSMDNWSVLNHTARAKLFQDACQGKVKWDSVNTEAYQAGLVYITKEEAPQIISTCDVNAIVKKAPATTIEANTDDPNAAEDKAAEELTARGSEDQPGGNIHRAGYYGGAPSPWVRPGPGYRPGPICNRPGCNDPRHSHRRGTPRCPSGMYFEGDRCRTPERQLPLNAYQQQVLSGCPTRIETRWVQRGTRMVRQQRCAPSL